jgi:hypothetical protein
MIRLLAVIAVLLPAPAMGQVTSYATSTPAPVRGDADKIVCKKEETLGTRLGARKICLTVEQWTEKHKEQRAFAEGVQSGTWGPKSSSEVENRAPQ